MENMFGLDPTLNLVAESGAMELPTLSLVGLLVNPIVLVQNYVPQKLITSGMIFVVTPIDQHSFVNMKAETLLKTNIPK